jgi:hypothetical protein
MDIKVFIIQSIIHFISIITSLVSLGVITSLTSLGVITSLVGQHMYLLHAYVFIAQDFTI